MWPVLIRAPGSKALSISCSFLRLYYSNYGQWTGIYSIFWELARNADSQAHPRPTDSESASLQDPKWFTCTLKMKRYCTKRTQVILFTIHLPDFLPSGIPAIFTWVTFLWPTIQKQHPGPHVSCLSKAQWPTLSSAPHIHIPFTLSALVIACDRIVMRQ